MTDRPALFGTDMVRRLLALQKWQTRRLAWGAPQPPTIRSSGGPRPSIWLSVQPGDRIWVREAWRPIHSTDPTMGVHYRADVGVDQTLWRPSIHMPRKASRITLVVTEVREQKLQDITAADAIAEGVPSTWGDWNGWAPAWAVASIQGHGDASGPHIWDNRTSVQNFAKLWNSIHGPYGWAANAEVVAVSFTPHLCNIDRMPSP